MATQARFKRKLTFASPALEKQVKAIVAGNTKDSVTVARNRTGYSTTQSTCLTSTTALSGTAAATTGLLDCNADEVRINSVQFKGYHELPAVADEDQTGNHDCTVRHLLVWFYKPLFVSSAAGTLPPITEVLESDTIHSLFINKAANGGRFVVISDKRWVLGTNAFQTGSTFGYAINTGHGKQWFDFTADVGKTVKFVSQPDSTNPGGHYDIDSTAGQVSRGLLVLYQQADIGFAGQVPTTFMNTRVNYTG